MPRAGRPPILGRPQTLREARRAYQKKARSFSLTAAQIRTAERAVQADKRAAEIQAKERRAREAKRRRGEQETLLKEEQRKLVQLGRLPLESLWGKVRASQQRLHNFFGAPEHAVGKCKAWKATLEGEYFGQVAASTDPLAGDSSGLGCMLSSAPATPKSQKAPPLSSQNLLTDASTCPEGQQLYLSSTKEEQDVRAVAGRQAQLEAQLSLSGSQLFSEFADDGDLEAELNGPPLPANVSDAPSVRHLNNKGRAQLMSPSPKRKPDEATRTTPQSAKNARIVFAQLPPSMLNTHAQEKVDSTLHSPMRTGVNHLTAVTNLENVPTASQVEAMFWSEESCVDNEHSDKENVNPSCTPPEIVCSAPENNVRKPSMPRPHMSPRWAAKLSVKPKVPAKLSLSGFQGQNQVYSNPDPLEDDSEDEFGGSVNDEFLRLASQISGIATNASQNALTSFSPKSLAVRRTPLDKRPDKQASPLRSIVRGLPVCTQDNFYDFDGVNDEDLAALVDTLNNHQNSANAASRQESSNWRQGEIR